MKHFARSRLIFVTLLISLTLVLGGCLSPVTDQANTSMASGRPSISDSNSEQSNLAEYISKDRSVLLAQARKIKTPTPSPSGMTTEQWCAELARLTNVERSKANLAELQTNYSNLSDAAAIRAKEISVSFSHTRPNGSFFTSVLISCNVNFSMSGENIMRASSGSLTPAQVIQTWMNSSGHKANILNSNYTSLGIGYYSSGGYDHFVQMFVRTY